MTAKINNKNLETASIVQIGLVLLLVFWLFTAAADAQTTNNNAQQQATATIQTTSETKTTPVLMPVLTDYKGVAIGMTADEVKDKLGKAKIEDKDGFYYKFSDDEAAQIALDKDKKVRAISEMYSGDNAPKYTDVFGTAAQTVTAPDGSIYNLVRYPEAGVWIAYSRSAGDKPFVTVTLQKMRQTSKPKTITPQ
ncbi:MAG: hypothetical protein ACR2N3_01230 [Pyrinomonadaceae bacterium]